MRVRCIQRPTLYGVVVSHDHDEDDPRGGLLGVQSEGMPCPWNAMPCDWSWVPENMGAGRWAWDADGREVEP